MVTDEMIKRINELAHKAKAEGLTEEEKAEQGILRRAYVDSFKANLRSMLENIELVDSPENSNKIHQKVKKSFDKNHTKIV